MSNYFFRDDVRVDDRVDNWVGERGAVGVWVVGRFNVLLLTGRSEGVCWPAGERVLAALARDTDRSRARIRSRACLSSVSAWIARSSEPCALSSVSLQTEKKNLSAPSHS